MIAYELICVEEIAEILNEHASLFTECAVLWRRLNLGEATLQEPVDELVDLLGRWQLARVEGSNNGRCFVHGEKVGVVRDSSRVSREIVARIEKSGGHTLDDYMLSWSRCMTHICWCRDGGSGDISGAHAQLQTPSRVSAPVANSWASTQGRRKYCRRAENIYSWQGGKTHHVYIWFTAGLCAMPKQRFLLARTCSIRQR